MHPMRPYLPVLLFIMTMGSVGNGWDAVLVRDDIPLEWIIAQAYSHKSGVPIVTTSPGELSPDTITLLQGYLASERDRLLILGGEAAISPGVEERLIRMGFITHRISEGDRYGTSARVALELYPGARSAVLVDGEDYLGLLTAEWVATGVGAPLLYVKEDEIPPNVMDTMTTMRIRDVYIIEGDLSDEVRDDLKARGFGIRTVGSEEDLTASRVPKEILYVILGIVIGVFFVVGAQALKRSRERVSYTLLMEDEEKVVRAIIENGGELTQDKLPEITDFSRPKISRMVADLAGRGILTKTPHGRTQKLKIEKEFYEKAKK